VIGKLISPTIIRCWRIQVPEAAVRDRACDAEDDDPSPAVLHFRGGRRSISKEVYPDLDVFFEDLAKTYRKAVEGVLRRRLPLSAVRRHRVGPISARRMN